MVLDVDPSVRINTEPQHVFEYEKTAWELADKVDGEVVELYYTSNITLWGADEEDFEFIGYGVQKEGELL